MPITYIFISITTLIDIIKPTSICLPTYFCPHLGQSTPQCVITEGVMHNILPSCCIGVISSESLVLCNSVFTIKANILLVLWFGQHIVCHIWYSLCHTSHLSFGTWHFPCRKNVHHCIGRLLSQFCLCRGNICIEVWCKVFCILTLSMILASLN